jgi:hypothetical protein
MAMEIAPAVARRAVIGEDHPPELLVVFPAFEELHRRQAQAFLIDIRGIAGEASRRLAADLRHMADAAREADQLLAAEDRLHQHMLGQMAVAAIGIVVDDDIAGLEEGFPSSSRSSARCS